MNALHHVIRISSRGVWWPVSEAALKSVRMYVRVSAIMRNPSNLFRLCAEIHSYNGASVNPVYIYICCRDMFGKPG